MQVDAGEEFTLYVGVRDIQGALIQQESGRKIVVSLEHKDPNVRNSHVIRVRVYDVGFRV